MEGRLLIKDCALWGPNGLLPGMAVAVADGRVLRIADNPEVPTLPGDWEVRARGRFLCAGEVSEGFLTSALAPWGGFVGDTRTLVAWLLARAARRGITEVRERGPQPPGADLTSLRFSFTKAAEEVGVRLVLLESEEESPIPTRELQQGQRSDLVLYDWVPPDVSLSEAEMQRERALSLADWTVVGGRVVVREGCLLSVDEVALAAEAALSIARHRRGGDGH